MNDLTVLKIGGSFINDHNLKNLKVIIKIIKKAIKKGGKHKLIIVTGGGRAADLVRDYDRQINLKDKSSHFAAITAMELNSYLISDYFNSYSFFSTDFSIFKKLNIFMPLNYYRKFDPLPYSWNVSSDSIALELSQRLNADNLFLIKQRTIKTNFKIKTKSAADNELIDNYFPKLYQDRNSKLKTIIINKKSIKKLEFLIKNTEVEILNKISKSKKDDFELNIIE